MVCQRTSTALGSELSPFTVGFGHRTQIIRLVYHVALPTGTSRLALSLILTVHDAVYFGLAGWQQAHGT